MANRLKGITVEIGGDTTKLQTALQGVNSEIRNTQAQLKDVEKLLKLDPGNTELIAQKHRLLGEAVDATTEKLEALQRAQEQATQALSNGDISQEQYDALQREIIETTEELRRLEEQANQSGDAVQDITAKGEQLQNLGGKISGVGQALMPITGAVVGLGTAAVKTAADFDGGMSKVAAISGATGDDLDALRDKAREMGAKTKFSASEAASAMEYMAMAGWKTEEMLNGIEGIMNLAAASGEDLATTSDIVTDALTAFGLSASDSGHFADILAAASSNANTNVSMMGETFKYAAPIAGALGFSAEDTAVAIGLMGNAGIKASQAGTSLRTIMNNLAGEVKFCGQNIGEVTIQTTNADGSMRELSDILADCRVAFSGLTESEAAAAAESLVGKNAMSGFLALMNAGDADVAKLTNAIANCDGVSQSMSGTMQDNMSGSLTILKSQLEELSISFGEMIMPILMKAVAFIQQVVDKLNHMDEGTRQIIITIAAVVAAVGPVLIVVGNVISAVGTIMTLVPQISAAITTVKTALTALHATMLANPIGIIIAAIAALVAAFIYLWNTNEEFRQFWINLWENVKEVAIAVWEAIKTFFTEAWTAIKTTAEGVFNGIRDFFTGIWDGIKNTATSVWNGIRDFLSGVWQSISSTVSSVWNAIKDTIGGIMQGIWETISSIWQSIYDTISPLLEAFRYLFETIFEAIHILIGRAMDAISAKITEIWNGIVSFLTPILEGIKSTFETIWNAVSTAVSTAMNAIKGVVEPIWNGIKSAVTEILNSIKSTVETIWNAIKTAISNALNAIQSVVSSVLNTVKNTVSTALNTVQTTFTNIWNNVKTTVSTALNSIAQGVSQVFNNIVNSIRTAMTNVLNAVKQGFNNVVSHIRQLISQAFGWGRDLIMGIVNGIKSCISAITSAVTSVADKIREVLHFSVPDKGPLTDYESWMPDFIGGLAQGIEKSRGMIQDAMNDVAGDMVISPNVTADGALDVSGDGSGGQNGALMSLLGQYLPYLPQLANMRMVTDTGALVGQLAPQMDEQLGRMAIRQRRQ